MAWYTEAAHLQAEKVTQVWTDTHGPAEKVQTSGIYRCKGCKREVTCNKNDPFRPNPITSTRPTKATSAGS